MHFTIKALKYSFHDQETAFFEKKNLNKSPIKNKFLYLPDFR